MIEDEVREMARSWISECFIGLCKDFGFTRWRAGKCLILGIFDGCVAFGNCHEGNTLLPGLNSRMALLNVELGREVQQYTLLYGSSTLIHGFSHP